MTERILGIFRKKEKLDREEVQFRFYDDPIFHDELTDKLIKHLVSKIKPEYSLSELINNHGTLSQEASEWIKKSDKSAPDQRENLTDEQRGAIICNALASETTLAELNLEHIESEDVERLREFAEKSLDYLGTNHISEDESVQYSTVQYKSLVPRALTRSLYGMPETRILIYKQL